MYSLAFFLADIVSTAMMGGWAERIGDPASWVPTVVSIAMGLAFAALISRRTLSWQTQIHLALVFEVLSSYGIALSSYLQVPRVAETPVLLHTGSPSWVAVWMMVFAVVVPAPPRRALLALLASALAPSVVIGVTLYRAGLGALLPPGMLFFHHVFPYLICVGLAYGAARIVYALGADVTRARELGSYRLIERVGQGGMGEVWRASHHRLARDAAIKFIRPEALVGMSVEESTAALRRFELEAHFTASLTSAHTIDLYDFGVADDGAFYYVMELLEGLDADTLVKRFGPMPAERVVWVLEQICHSLSEEETCGHVHRDIKPANIFLCRYGEDHDFVKVLDFGIAKPTTDTAASETALTVMNVIHGTPAFIAPEQALGGADLDTRADIYSTGCVAFWLLTGELVFTAETPMKLLMAHAHSAPQPPSAKTELPIPLELDELVLSCLAKDRANRPASASDLLQRLQAVKLESSWTDERARTWWRTHLPPQ
jgi:serine/threonine-protein kinase